MEEFRASRFFRPENELHRTPVGRAFWRQVRAGYDRPAQQTLGPYETSYDVSRGYSPEERAL